MQGDAEAKRHSTTSEAIGVGLAMRARRVVLTHFSQRYQKLPVMEGLTVDKVKLEDAEDRNFDEPMVDAEAAKMILPNMDETAPSNLPSAKSTSPMIAWNPLEAEQPTAKPIDDKSATSVRRSSGSVVPVPFSTTEDMKVCVAFDYMKVKVGEIEYMEKLTPTLQKLYQTGDLDDINEKQAEESANASSKNDSKGKRVEKPRKSNEEINRGKEKRGKNELKNKPREEEQDDVRVDAPKEIDIVDEDQYSLTDALFDGDRVDGSRMIEGPRVRRVMNSDSGQPQAKNGPNEEKPADALSVNRVPADRQDVSGRSRSNRRINKTADKETDQRAKLPTPRPTRNTIHFATIQVHNHEEQVTTTTEKLNPSAVYPKTTHRFRKEDIEVDNRKRSNRGAVAKIEGRGGQARILVDMPYSTFRHLLSRIESRQQQKSPTVEPRGLPSPAGKCFSHPEQCTSSRRYLLEPTASPLEHTPHDALRISRYPSQPLENILTSTYRWLKVPRSPPKFVRLGLKSGRSYEIHRRNPEALRGPPLSDIV